jgi:serine/threonine protein kinase
LLRRNSSCHRASPNFFAAGCLTAGPIKALKTVVLALAEQRRIVAQADAVKREVELAHRRAQASGSKDVPMPNLTGTILGQYQILEQIGHGLTVLYRAYQPQLDRYVVVKALTDYLLDDSAFLDRFRREVEVLTRLHHPNIMRLLDHGQEHGMPYLVMEYVTAGSVQDLLDKADGRPLPLSSAASIALQVAAALGYAHAQSILHQDIKPANILVDDQGHVLLTDFGLTNITWSQKTNVLLTTPRYMAPEQVLGQAVDRRTDLYSLGVVLYHMVTGHVPFEAETILAVMLKHVNEAVPLPRQFNPRLPDGVERVLLKALSKKPDDRYQTAQEMIEAINRLIVPSIEQADFGADGTALRQFLIARFNLEELRTLCADLDVSYDELEGEGQEAKARELIAYLQRRERLRELVGYIRQHRPDIKLA